MPSTQREMRNLLEYGILRKYHRPQSRVEYLWEQSEFGTRYVRHIYLPRGAAGCHRNVSLTTAST